MKNFKLLDFKNYGYIFSVVTIVIILIIFLFNGVILDISFQGGTRITLETTASVNVESAVAVAKKAIGREITGSITKTYDPLNKTNQVEMLRLDVSGTEPLTEAEMTSLRTAVAAEFPVKLDSSRNETASITPSIGRETLQRGILAIIISSLLILFYVAWRFVIMSGFSAAFTAVLALVHDVIMIFGVYVIFRLPLNDGFIAAVLTVVGYSINDTIIMYDRIRENTTVMRKLPMYDIVNNSVNQTIARSINTVLTVVFCLVSLWIFSAFNNITSLKDFSFSLTVGVISGSYSSICIAVPLWFDLKHNKGKKKVQPAQ